MLHLILILSCVLATQAQSAITEVDLDPNHNLKYVFEIVRHGARAPIQAGEGTRFEAGFRPGELTPNGMRQRYFLGRYNYQRYHQALGDDLQTKDKLYVESTNVHRTLQSGYSELLGQQMQSKLSLPQLSQAQQDDLKTAGSKSSPPFEVRDAAAIGTNLSADAAPVGFVNFPIYTYITKSSTPLWQDDLDWGACHYAGTAEASRRANATIYKDYVPLQQSLADAFAGEGFVDPTTNKTLDSADFAAMTYGHMQAYADTIIAEQWNMEKPKHNWTSTELDDLNKFQGVSLWLAWTDYARQLLITKQMLRPLREIIQNEKGKNPISPKYLLYSAHDTNIANHLMAYMPSVDQTEGIPFAASIYLELYDVFGVWYVQGMYNGAPVSLRGCGGHAYCEYTAFEKHMDDLLYTGDLEAACAPAYKPTDPDSIPQVSPKAAEDDSSPTFSFTSLFDLTDFSGNIFGLLWAAFKFNMSNVAWYFM